LSALLTGDVIFAVTYKDNDNNTRNGYETSTPAGESVSPRSPIDGD